MENERFASWSYKLPDGGGRRALVTGITGSDGSLAAHMLVERGYAVHGLVRWHSRRDRIHDIVPNLTLHEANLTDPYTLARAVEEAEPDIVFHLAGQHFVPASWRSPLETMNTNVLGTTNLLESLRRRRDTATVVLLGSGEQYGTNEAERLSEDDAFNPLSPFAVSKVACDLMGYQYHANYGMRTVRLRVFNTAGPGRRDVFLANSLARAFAQAQVLGKDRVKVPACPLVRDFIDARDAVKGYLMAGEKGAPGQAYNICSGIPRTIRSLAEKLSAIAPGKPSIVEDDSCPLSEIGRLVGDPGKMKRDTGWVPEIELEQTLREMFSYWVEGHGRRGDDGRGDGRDDGAADGRSDDARLDLSMP